MAKVCCSLSTEDYFMPPPSVACATVSLAKTEDEAHRRLEEPPEYACLWLVCRFNLST